MMMSRTVIALGTANRPEVLNRCLEAVIADCSIAREAHWIVLDDSCPDDCVANRGVVQFWRQAGLEVTYVDKVVEDEIADSLAAVFATSFAHLVARTSSCRAPGGRNLALLTALSASPKLVFFIDDDIVHRHEGNWKCFFHWCANACDGESFVAAPRKLGIRDMTYLNRLLTLLDRQDWFRFISSRDISAESLEWCSPQNPLWKVNEALHQQASPTCSAREVVSGQFMAIRDTGTDWIPFPKEYNEDVTWSLLQSSLYGTPLLKVNGVCSQHLPPKIGHSEPENIVSELVGTSITRTLRQINFRGEDAFKELRGQIQDGFCLSLKQEVFLLLRLERSIRMQASTCTDPDARDALKKLERTLVDVQELLKEIDPPQTAAGWLDDFETRRAMFTSLRRDEMIQRRISHVLQGASV